MKFRFIPQSYGWLIASLVVLAAVSTFLYIGYSSESPHFKELDRFEYSEQEEQAERMETKVARKEYFNRMFRDPTTGQIPAGIHTKELAFIEQMKNSTRYKTPVNSPKFNWQEIGPTNVGGRTRALAVDVTDSDVIIAGGASGGIWKSTDGGKSWNLKSSPSQITGVTTVTQDTRPGHTNTWYFATGEVIGGGNSTFGEEGYYYGTGVYKSNDNGEHWFLMEGTDATPGGNSYQADTPYDFVTRIKVNPQTGSVFIASNGVGIVRSTDGKTFDPIPLLGKVMEQIFCDIDIAEDGTIMAYISQSTMGPGLHNPGIFVSHNDGETWKEVTPETFPETYMRSVIAIAPSNTNYGYALTYTGEGSGSNEDVRFHWINLETGKAEDRSANLPDFGGLTGFVNTAINYAMTLAVHPTDPNFVIIGGTNLFRSRDGFSTTASTNKDEHWIGGFSPENTDYSVYPNHHADQQALFFDPNDPDRLWSGHDGGLSVTNNIRAVPIKWQDMNNGYNVTQFYEIDLPEYVPYDRIMGGTQDNGTPFFHYTTSADRNNSTLATGADGGVAYFGKTFAYTSYQNGKTFKHKLDNNGEISSDWHFVHPSQAKGMLFIHPWVIDPNDENYMFYPAEDASGNYKILKNNRLSEIENKNYDGTVTGWSPLDNTKVPRGYFISALEISRAVPEQRLYYGTTATDQKPIIYRLDNARTNTAKPDSSLLPGVPEGAYVLDIVVHPRDADKVMVVVSNYNVPSLFYSDDGGNNWINVEGNLGGGNSYPEPGPSVRTAGMLPTDNGTVYIVGTSVGLFTTSNLNGINTIWQQTADQELGTAWVQDIDIRTRDNKIAVGTYGRGIFLGTYQTASPIADNKTVQPVSYQLGQNYPNPFNPSTTVNYTLGLASKVTLTIYDLQGREVMKLLQEKNQSAGEHKAQFKADNLASGVYLYRLSAKPIGGGQEFIQTRKMTLMK